MTVQPTRDQLRALANAATPGPWEFPSEILGLPNSSIFAVDTNRSQVAHVALSGGADAAFIVAARTAVPQFLDQLDAAEQRIRDLTQEVRDERAACLDQMEQVRIRDERIKAVEDVLEAAYDDQVSFYDIRRALEG